MIALLLIAAGAAIAFALQVVFLAAQNRDLLDERDAALLDARRQHEKALAARGELVLVKQQRRDDLILLTALAERVNTLADTVVDPTPDLEALFAVGGADRG